MFKKLENAWNSRTPVWLHNGTKENIAFQLGLTVLYLGVMIAYDRWQDRKFRKELESYTPTNED